MSAFPSFRSIKQALLILKGSTAEAEGNTPKKEIGMVSRAEIDFFRECAALCFGKPGAIVDLGCWLGSTSVALAQGILSCPSAEDHPDERVLGFDTFIWRDWMPSRVPYCVYEAGESFLPEARRIARDYGGNRVEMVQADLREYRWQGGPIKLLLVDAMKDEDLAIQIIRNFFPSLVAGSLLIHQDFKHYYTSWIHIFHFRLRKYFIFHQGAGTGTTAFHVREPIPDEAIGQATNAASTDEEADAALDYSFSLVAVEEHAHIAAAHVMYYIHANRRKKASELVERYRPTGMVATNEFKKP